MDRAAKRAGLPVSVWARERLFDGLVRVGEIASDDVVTVRGVKS
jgi:hypothetical protein